MSTYRFAAVLRFSDSFKSYYDRRFCDSRGRAIYVPSLSRVWLPHPATIFIITQFYNSLGSRS